MTIVPVPLSSDRSYNLQVGAPLSGLGRVLSRIVSGRRALLVAPGPVAKRYAREVLRGLERAGFSASLAVIPDGERHKNLAVVQKIYREGLRAGLDRKSVFVALGGGVTGDMTGFAAATYMRGVAVAQVPTTLLAMVDSAIGGKTGVDLPEGKNLVGAFWQPKAVWMDLSVLKTLPDREWRTGMAEVIKYGLIEEARILKIVRTETLASLRKKPALLAELVRRSAACKARIVSADEKETRGLREILNLGHTFGHALETVTGYDAYTHGEAISVGMCAAARLGAGLGTFAAGDVPAVDALFSRWGLPSRARRPVSRAKILEAMSRDKKNVGGTFRFIIPSGWSKAKAVSGVGIETVNSVLNEVGL
jgi:3-dehydroquinate synthase